jgi:hypothetical protein
VNVAPKTNEVPSPAMLRRVAIASCIGTTVEWYDFFIYATASALIFNKLFFPSLNPLIGSLVALGTYAAGFIARPVGELVFGIIAAPLEDAGHLRFAPGFVVKGVNAYPSLLAQGARKYAEQIKAIGG